jgi:hypothetical protein
MTEYYLNLNLNRSGKMINKYFLLFFVSCSLLFSQENNDMNYYSCTINKTDKIKMRLEIQKNQITGNYVILASGIRINFKGTLDNNSFILSGQNGILSREIMKGKFNKDYSSFTGIMLDTSYKRNSKINGLLEYKGKTLKSKEFRISVNYPYLTNTNPFNRKEIFDTLDAIAKEELQYCLNEAKIYTDNNPDEEGKQFIKTDYQWETNIYIENLSKNILSVLKINSHYFGTAKPNHRYFSINYDKRNNDYKLLSLADLIKEDTAYRRVISDLILEDLAKKKATLVLSKDIKDLTDDLRNEYLTYLILPEGIRYDFAPNTVGLLDEGSFFVFIPFKKIKDILNLKGVLSEYKIK